jgi:hypothetical protein
LLEYPRFYDLTIKISALESYNIQQIKHIDITYGLTQHGIMKQITPLPTFKFEAIDVTVPFFVITINQGYTKYMNGFEIPWALNTTEDTLECTLYKLNSKYNPIIDKLDSKYNPVLRREIPKTTNSDNDSLINLQTEMKVHIEYKWRQNTAIPLEGEIQKYNMCVHKCIEEYKINNPNIQNYIEHLIQNPNELTTYQERLSQIMNESKIKTDFDVDLNRDDEIIEVNPDKISFRI